MTPRQMINIELAARSVNTRAKDLIKKHVPAEHQDDLLIDFNCECSDDGCIERVSLTLQSYEDLHDTKARFVITPGHDEPIVEKVHRQTKDFAVVDKYAL